MTIDEQITILNEIIDKAIEVSKLSFEQIISKSRKPNIVAIRVYITRLATQEKIDIRIISKKLNIDRTMIYHYLYRYKETFDYELLKYGKDM